MTGEAPCSRESSVGRCRLLALSWICSCLALNLPSCPQALLDLKLGDDTRVCSSRGSRVPGTGASGTLPAAQQTVMCAPLCWGQKAVLGKAVHRGRGRAGHGESCAALDLWLPLLLRPPGSSVPSLPASLIACSLNRMRQCFQGHRLFFASTVALLSQGGLVFLFQFTQLSHASG